MIYLDSAATSLLKPASVENAVVHSLRSAASPGRGGHKPSSKGAEILFLCREEAAELFHVDDPGKIVFTFNATHGLNIAINTLVKEGSKVLISGFEHNSVTRPLKALNADIFTAGENMFDKADALKDFKGKIKQAGVVICTHVSNVFGFILPIREIAEICAAEGVPLIIDASQSAGILDVDAQMLKAAFIAMPGHKGLMGPQGTGILICGNKPMPLMHGGSGSDSLSQTMPDYLPDALEAGTHNVCGIAGLLAGIRYVKEKGTENIFRHERKLMDIMIDELTGQQIELFISDAEDQSGVLSFRTDKLNCEVLADRLAQRDICVRAGLHCAPLAHRSAQTLETGTVRLSFSPFLTENQVISAAREIKLIIKNA